MLNVNKSITLSGLSIFNGIIAQRYQAIVDSKDPEKISLSNWLGDYATYKEYRDECATERKQFEDEAFKLQQEMLTEKGE